ncbi:MAG: hypothetical protein ACI9VR_002866, partial [Cognaticolwellia sp.]
KNAAEACERKPRMWSVCLIEGVQAARRITSAVDSTGTKHRVCGSVLALPERLSA